MDAASIDDYKYAQDICKGDKKARNKFIRNISDKAFWVAKKWNNNPQVKNEHFHFKTIEGKSINTDDDVQDTWVWLLKKLVNATCKYEGIKNASLLTYIYSVLNGKFTFNDWLKSKYGNTQYVPGCLNTLSTIHQETYIGLKRKKDDHQLSNELDIPLLEIQYIISEIKYILFTNKKPQPEIFKHLKFISKSEADDEKEIDIEDPHAKIIEPDFEIIYPVISGSYKSLSKTDQRILMLYWGEGLDINQIIEFINSEEDLDSYSELNIKTDKEFYSYITKICSTCKKWIKNNHMNTFNEYNLETGKIKNAIKALLINFKIK